MQHIKNQKKKENNIIPEMKQNEVEVLKKFLQETFYVAHGSTLFSKDIIYLPENQIYKQGKNYEWGMLLRLVE